jgi:hypothetical protein
MYMVQFGILSSVEVKAEYHNTFVVVGDKI